MVRQIWRLYPRDCGYIIVFFYFCYSFCLLEFIEFRWNYIITSLSYLIFAIPIFHGPSNPRRLFASKSAFSRENRERCECICEGALEGEWVVARMKSRRRKGEPRQAHRGRGRAYSDPNNDRSRRSPDPRRISLIARKLHTASDPLSRYSRCDLARCVYVDCR